MQLYTPNKQVYSLGQACYPHLLSRQRYPHLTSPSLFAGCAYIQQMYDRFIPTILFTGEIKDIFFGLDNWDILERDYTRDIFRNTRTGYSFYYNNVTKEAYSKTVDNFRPKDELLYINKHVPIINFHPLQKTPGNNPQYEEYQRKKYEFWLEHRLEQYYLIETTRYMKREQIEDFLNIVSDIGYDINRFIVFEQEADYSKLGKQQFKLLKDYNNGK